MVRLYTYKITLSNPTSTATPPNLQVRLNINFASLVSNINADLGNIRFSSDQAGNNLLYAWLESAPQGTFTQGSSVSSYTSSNVWVNLGNNIISANGSLNIYMQVFSSGTDFDGVYWGANPLWTSTYGQYDNGAKVFSIYFNGNTPISDFSVDSNSSLSQTTAVFSNGVTINVLKYLSASTASATDALIYTGSSVGAGEWISESSFASDGSGIDQGATGLGQYTSAGTSDNMIQVDTQFGSTYFGESYVSSGTLHYGINSQGTTTTSFRYATLYDNTTNSFYGYISPQLYSTTGGYSGTVSINPISSLSNIYWMVNPILRVAGHWIEFNWARVRAYPPNGTDPVLTSIQILFVGNYTSSSTPVPNWSALRGKPYVTVSAKGISNGLSNIPNDGADFGPDTPGTTTGGIMEAKEALPKVQNQYTLRMVPSGTIEIHFGGYPIKMTSPIIFYDDEFINLISPDGFSQPIQPPNKPTVYIENTTGDPAFIMYPNPTVPSTAGVDLGNGIFRMDGISFMNTTSTGNGIFVFKRNPGGCYPNPSMFIGGVISVYDASEENFPLFIVTNGNDDDIHIYDLTVVGATIPTANMVTISANHVIVGMLHAFSLTSTSSTPNYGQGFMVNLGAGGNMHIGVLDCFSYGANGVLNIGSNTGVDGGDTAVIDEFYDETSGVVGNADGGNGSFENHADLFIGTISAAGGAFTKIQPHNVPVKIGASSKPSLTNNLLPSPTLTANPPVSGTVYQNTNLYDIRIYLPAYATTSGTAGSVAIALGSTSTPSTIGTKFINGSTSSSATEIIELVVPGGWYYEFTATGVTFGTATVFPA
ncbi:MAG: hypothetical protein QW203_06975 [Thermoplasmatales archaeon]